MLKARVVGFIKRMPGLYDISGYRPAIYFTPGIIITEPQMKQIIDLFSNKNTAFKKNYDDKMEKLQNSTNGLPKKMIYVNV